MKKQTAYQKALERMENEVNRAKAQVERLAVIHKQSQNKKS